MESNRIPHVIVEGNIPFVRGLLEPYCRVDYLAPDAITREAVADADALLVRTRTRCDSALLAGSRCRFVGTATIGTDHIDLDWCRAQGITVANAPGCNAPAVAQYVLASVLRLADRPIDDYTIGIIGVGHVGSIVERWAAQLGMRVLVNDPPRQLAESRETRDQRPETRDQRRETRDECRERGDEGNRWSTLADIAREADIITVHTPLDASTRHLIGPEFIAAMQRRPIVINAARGAVVDTPALVEALRSGAVSHAVIDCWEGEPAISPELLALASIATPHIAGYSYEGKVRATRMVVDSLCAHLGLPRIDMLQQVAPGAAESITAEAISASYDPLADTAALRSCPSAFERLRNAYTLRHEA